ncbi:MAG: GSU2403 family nucleotidyltransferase fold protein [Rhizobiaceae bacterium]
MLISEITDSERRQLIDTRQVYEAWLAADHDSRRRYAGSMRWAKRSEREYLLRKISNREVSLGPRSAETEAIYSAFTEGRQDVRNRLAALSAQLNKLAAINRAMGLGRLPVVAARILRRCHEQGLLGSHLLVVGTNALFGYEAMAGVRIEPGLTSTADIDLLHDARRRLGLAFENFRRSGLIGLLQRADRSFAPQRAGDFRAVNSDGYIVDLIRPRPRDAVSDWHSSAMTGLPEDLAAVDIDGLEWLLNAPKVETILLDIRGYPVRMAMPDPRVFAVHKAWMAKRADRDPLKIRRDKGQAEAAASIAHYHLGLDFEGLDLSALPLGVRAEAALLVKAGPKKDAETSPDW